MAEDRTILLCSCEDTMPIDASAVRKACRGAAVASGRQLCRAELDRFRAALKSGASVTVACTQEAPLFAETAGDQPVSFVNIRETAGWSKDAGAAGPKMAALIAAAAEPLPPTRFIALESQGVILV